jgi:23S rRNA (adenine2503-C2)-methyltransferase
VGCGFCASGLKGLVRNLTAGEILAQVLLSSGAGVSPVTNIVFMGVGEPLMNLKNLAWAIQTLNHPEGMGFGARRMTVSTVGLPEGIRNLADLKLQINLAISLHTAFEEKRKKLIPLANKIPLSELLESADYFRMKTTRDVTYEVLLLREVNDGPEDAQSLAALLKGQKCLVNLIPFNPSRGIPFNAPSQNRVSRFRKVLEDARIPVTVRKPRGTDILAACGQLRMKATEGNPE